MYYYKLIIILLNGCANLVLIHWEGLIMLGFQIFIPLLKPIFSVFFLVAIIIALQTAFWFLRYKKSKYGEVSGNNFWKSTLDKGNFGEFLTFRVLERLPGDYRLLTNIYLPKMDGTTTEIDLVLISSKGLFVFESKNYCGWIFGDEKNKNWTQSLKGGKKIRFLNPIWQNKSHITALRSHLSDLGNQALFSYVVFSERCELKKVTVTISDIKVIKRNNLFSTLSVDLDLRPDTLSDDQVNTIFDRLRRLTRMDEETKARHIQKIKERIEAE